MFENCVSFVDYWKEFVYNDRKVQKGVFALTISEKIRLLARRRGITITALAGKIGMTRQNLSIKLKNDNFTTKEIQKIAGVLNCVFDTVFVMNDTGEKI